MRNNKLLKIKISNLRKATDINNCYHIQDCIIDTLMTIDCVKSLGFERESNCLSIYFNVPISRQGDEVWTLCKEYLIVLLEQNEKVDIEIQEKEEIEDYIIIYKIALQR